MLKTIKIGIISGLMMGISLFIAGAIFARIIYGSDMAPEGKFEESQMNAFYFIWTKLLIGVFFGILFTSICNMSSLSNKIIGSLKGLKYSFVFWLVISLWNISHPLTYNTLNYSDQIFWLLYTLVGFLVYGITMGILNKQRLRNG
jgi:hypothetical protein